jgi:hypothetical protein
MSLPWVIVSECHQYCETPVGTAEVYKCADGMWRARLGPVMFAPRSTREIADASLREKLRRFAIDCEKLGQENEK